MFTRLKLLIHLLPILIYLSGCGFSGNESEFGSSSSSSSSSSNWLTKTSIPTKRWGGSVGAVIGTKIYQIGGGVVDAADKVVEIYETTTDTWSTGTSLNKEQSYTLDAFAVSGGKIFMLRLNNYAEVFSPDNDSWSNLSLDSTSLMSHGAVAPFGTNSIYIFGGGSESSDNNSTRKLNTDNHTITLHSNMPRARASGCAETDGSKIYLIGGLNSSGLISYVDVYDPSSDNWETKSSTLPNPSKYFGCAYYQDKIYLTGYSNDKIVNVYDVVNDTWSTIESLPSNRSAVSVSIVNGVLYVMAGCCNDNNNNWAFDLK